MCAIDACPTQSAQRAGAGPTSGPGCGLPARTAHPNAASGPGVRAAVHRRDRRRRHAGQARQGIPARVHHRQLRTRPSAGTGPRMLHVSLAWPIRRSPFFKPGILPCSRANLRKPITVTGPGSTSLPRARGQVPGRAPLPGDDAIQEGQEHEADDVNLPALPTPAPSRPRRPLAGGSGDMEASETSGVGVS